MPGAPGVNVDLHCIGDETRQLLEFDEGLYDSANYTHIPVKVSKEHDRDADE